jgi:hypothetical protein
MTLAEWSLIHVLGYFLAAAAPVPFLWWAGRLLWKHIVVVSGGDPDKARDDHLPLPPALVGAVERCLYLGALLEGYPGLIGAWFVLKVAGAWTGWSQGMPAPARDRFVGTVYIKGRLVFNTGVISNGLSLAHAFAAAAAIELALAGHRCLAPWVALAPFLLTLGTIGWTTHEIERLEGKRLQGELSENPVPARTGESAPLTGPV